MTADSRRLLAAMNDAGLLGFHRRAACVICGVNGIEAALRYVEGVRAMEQRRPVSYGAQTVARPAAASVRRSPTPGWVLTRCPYCDRPCWWTPREADAMTVEIVGRLGGFTAACSACAVRRGIYQREMDADRWGREMAAVDELPADWGLARRDQ